MPRPLAASQPARTSARVPRPVLRYEASQPAGVRVLSPPPVPVRLELNGIGEEEAIVELEDLQQGDVDEDTAVQEGEGEAEVEGEAEAEDGGRVDLRPFTNALVPGPMQAPFPDDAEGWSQIDGWGAYDCAVSSIVPMEEVPGPFRKTWQRFCDG